MINKRLISEIGPSIRYVRKCGLSVDDACTEYCCYRFALCFVNGDIGGKKDRSRTAGGSRIVLVGSDRAAMEIKLHGGCLR